LERQGDSGIHHVHDRTIGDGVTNNPSGCYRVFFLEMPKRFVGEAVPRLEICQRPIKAEDAAALRLAEQDGISGYGIEYGLHVMRGDTNDAQNLGGRSLASMTLAQFSLQLLDRATTILVFSGCRSFGWHDDIQSFEFSAKLLDVPAFAIDRSTPTKLLAG